MSFYYSDLMNEGMLDGDTIIVGDLTITNSLDVTGATITGFPVDNTSIDFNGSNELEVKNLGITNDKIVSVDASKITGAFPVISTASIHLTDTSNQILFGTGTVTTMNVSGQTSSKTYNVPDVTNGAYFVMNNSPTTQTITGDIHLDGNLVCTLGGGLSYFDFMSCDQIKINNSTITSDSLSLINIAIPDPGVSNSKFLLNYSDQFISGKLSVGINNITNNNASLNIIGTYNGVIDDYLIDWIGANQRRFWRTKLDSTNTNLIFDYVNPLTPAIPNILKLKYDGNVSAQGDFSSATLGSATTITSGNITTVNSTTINCNTVNRTSGALTIQTTTSGNILVSPTQNLYLYSGVGSNVYINPTVGLNITNGSTYTQIQGFGSGSDLIKFLNTSGTARYHFQMPTDGSSNAFSITETGVADYRLYIKPGGNVGIGTNTVGSKLTVAGTGSYSGAVSITDSTDSTTTSTGCLILTGGLGSAKQITSLTYKSTGTTDSTSLTTGSIITAGGIGCSKNVTSLKLTTTGTTDSTSTSTGTIITPGGIGCAKTGYFGTGIVLPNSSTLLNTSIYAGGIITLTGPYSSGQNVSYNVVKMGNSTSTGCICMFSIATDIFASASSASPINFTLPVGYRPANPQQLTVWAKNNTTIYESCILLITGGTGSCSVYRISGGTTANFSSSGSVGLYATTISYII
jgi:hypothetical protein